MPYPYIGKSVHYVAPGDPDHTSQCRAALVTDVLPVEDLTPPGTYVNLYVIDDETATHQPSVAYEEVPYSPGTWHEPETGF